MFPAKSALRSIVGFAIHSGLTAGRFRHVSVEQSLVRDQESGDAFVAVSK